MCTVVALETIYRAMNTSRYMAYVLNFAEHPASVEVFLPLCRDHHRQLFYKGEFRFITK